MSVENNGGPAFPESGLSGLPNGDFYHGQPGMMLRDYFAGKAMIALQFDKGSAYCAPVNEMNFDVQAATAYAMADAMLKARQS